MTSGVPVGSNVRIRVSTLAGERDFEGAMLPPAGEGLITLKLVNGYNLSYPEEDVLDTELLGEAGDGAVQEDSAFEVLKEKFSQPNMQEPTKSHTSVFALDYRLQP